VTAAAPTSFTIEPEGPFSLQLAAGFGFGPEEGKPPAAAAVMRLAFLLDDLRTHTAVTLTQDAPDGLVAATLHPQAPAAAVEATAGQVARVLSLDHDARPYAALGQRDPVIGALQRRHHGLRPVLFHSPYEAAAWAVISHRRPSGAAAVTRAALAQALGTTFVFDDDAAGRPELHAFPAPQRLLDDLRADAIAHLNATRVERLHAIARAALDGDLDPHHLRDQQPAQALEALERLPGIGPFWAMLILVRSTGATDVLPEGEARLARAVGKAYALPEPPDAAAFAALAERWRPFRTWASVLIRYDAGHQAAAER
jgi:DNA-3-methyladenine glycosylase II